MAELNFPKGFIWGTATASYQIEGAVNEDGRGKTIWDRFSHTPGKIENGDTGDIACDHYHRYREDTAMMKELGLNAYRFSIAWSRILPEGKGQVNQKGIDFYNSLIDELLEKGINPAVTLYHWDLPQKLQDYGGWGNRNTIDYFTDYSELAIKTFGDRVKLWITHNEPIVASFYAHADGAHAPGLKDHALAVQVSHHLLLSHAKVVQVFRELNQNDSKIGITLNLTPIYSASQSVEDQNIARLVDGEKNRWFLDPVFKGSYPNEIMRIYQEKFNAPVIKPGDMELLSGAKIDFLGINYYMRAIVEYAKDGSPLPYRYIAAEGSNYTDMGWEVYPEGLYQILTRVSRDYGNPHIYITENGAAYYDDDKIVNGIVQDDERLEYLNQHFTAAHRAISDGVKLDGYFIWSLMDNFEWAHGFSKRFGLIRVDYDTQVRSWKKSAYWYQDVIRNNGI